MSGRAPIAALVAFFVLNTPAMGQRYVASAVKRRAASPAAARWMKGMTLRDEVAQLVMIPFNGRPYHTRSREFQHFVKLIRTAHVGGMVLVNVAQGRVVQRAQPLELASFINKAQRYAKVPLIIGGDFERGVSMRVDGATVFPHAMAFTAGHDPSAARFEGEVTAREARALGVQWIFYPVADVNNNPDNPIINIRSFGEDPQDVAAYVQAFIEGAQSNRKDRVLTTAKHFPGHGDTSTDSHVNIATIAADRKHLAEVEFVPFRAAIEKGVDSIMTAHIAVPALDAPDVPATLSPVLLTKVLREELGFKGIIVTDALDMGGIAKGFTTGEAAVRAIEGGVDVLLMPTDPEAAINAVVSAVKSGRITRQRIQQSVMRVLLAKARVGLDRTRVVKLDDVDDAVNSPDDAERAQQIADRAITLVKNDQDVVPLHASSKACFVTLAESRTSNEGQAFAQQVRKLAPDANILALDTSMTAADLVQTSQRTAACDVIVVAAFVSVAAYRGDVALGGEFPGFLTNLIATKKPVVLVALGNPYLLRSFPSVSAYLATYSTVAPSEISAVRALFGEIAIQGKLPVTIPGLAKYGDGIPVPLVR